VGSSGMQAICLPGSTLDMGMRRVDKPLASRQLF
jgi:hypothetical protein